MPLKGELRDFSTTQLLNLINLAGKTGTLTIFQAAKPGVMEEVNGKKTREDQRRAGARAGFVQKREADLRQYGWA